MTHSPPDGDPSAPGGRAVPRMRGKEYESFVVRLLIGYDGEIVHGQVTHVASGQRRHFTDPEHLPNLIRRQLANSTSARFVPHIKPS